jgi:hypothetical protein
MVTSVFDQGQHGDVAGAGFDASGLIDRYRVAVVSAVGDV